MTNDHHMPCSLAQASQGKSYIIQSLNISNAAFRQQLFSMGLLPGSLIHVVRYAPLGDPIQVDVLGTQLALRKADAAQIIVVLAPKDTD